MHTPDWGDAPFMSDYRKLLITGGLLAGLLAGIVALSPLFAYGAPLTAGSAFGFTALMMLAGFSAPALVRLLPGAQLTLRQLGFLLLLGVGFRLVFFSSTPIYEDDWYRYLWDGAVVAAGINPYRYAPADAIDTGLEFADPSTAENADILRLRELDAAEANWPERVNYPYLTTIYPPLFQLAALLANKISAFSLDAWRAVLFAFDSTGLLILLCLLRRLERPLAWALVYWWNPLLITATFNAGHMDVLLVPFLLGAVLLATMNRVKSAVFMLAGAVGVKLWPLILLPPLIAARRARPRVYVALGVLCLALSVLFVWPLLATSWSGRSGLAAYSLSWERFSFLFAVLHDLLSFATEQNGRITRVLVGGVVVAASVYSAVVVRKNPAQLPAALMFVTSVLFFLSPTGYPWYVIWLLVLLPVVPTYGIAALSVTLPLYYTRYYLDFAGQAQIFEWLLTPLAFTLPLAILFFEYRWRKTRWTQVESN